MKKIFVLGSTGSIGVNTLNVIRKFPDRFKISVLSVNSSTDLLLVQVNEFKPELVIVKEEDAAKNIAGVLPNGCRLLVNEEGLITAAAEADYDIFVGEM